MEAVEHAFGRSKINLLRVLLTAFVFISISGCKRKDDVLLRFESSERLPKNAPVYIKERVVGRVLEIEPSGNKHLPAARLRFKRYARQELGKDVAFLLTKKRGEPCVDTYPGNPKKGVLEPEAEVVKGGRKLWRVAD